VMKALRALIPVLLASALCPARAQPVGLHPGAEPSGSRAQWSNQRIAGKWLLAIEATALKKSVKPVSSCSDQAISLDFNAAFAASTVSALKDIFEYIEEIHSPVVGGEAKARKAKGLIVVRADDLGARLIWEAGLFVSHVDLAASVSASVSVDIGTTRVLAAIVKGQSEAANDSRDVCSRGEQEVMEIAAAATEDAVNKLTMVLRESEYLRSEK
jgi:hypothetical protein